MAKIGILSDLILRQSTTFCRKFIKKAQFSKKHLLENFVTEIQTNYLARLEFLWFFLKTKVSSKSAFENKGLRVPQKSQNTIE